MKRILFLLAALWITVPSFATIQFPERLIVGNDTLSMFAYPLEYADSTMRMRLDARLEEADVPISTACWRGYVGCWRLEEGQLWLERVYTCTDKPLFTAAELFPEWTEGGRVRASWFSGEICYGRGEVICYERRAIFEEEWTASVEAGKVGPARHFRNRAYKWGVDLQENQRRLSEAFDRLGPTDSLPPFLAFSVHFAADSTGHPVRILRSTLFLSGDTILTDSSDPLVQRARRAFMESTRWDACWIHGAWQEFYYALPLRRNGAPWKSRENTR